MEFLNQHQSFQTKVTNRDLFKLVPSVLPNLGPTLYLIIQGQVLIPNPTNLTTEISYSCLVYCAAHDSQLDHTSCYTKTEPNVTKLHENEFDTRETPLNGVSLQILFYSMCCVMHVRAQEGRTTCGQCNSGLPVNSIFLTLPTKKWLAQSDHDLSVLNEPIKKKKCTGRKIIRVQVTYYYNIWN